MKKRVLAIDYGKKRVGIAVSDPLNLFAIPVATLSNDANLMVEIKKIIAEKEVGKIVLGYPLKEDGSRYDFTLEVEKFKKKLENVVNLEIEFVDERYSSSVASERILQSVPSRKKRQNKALIDQGAAAVILEDYLNGI